MCRNSWTYIVDLILCMTRNFYFIFCYWTPKNFYLQSVQALILCTTRNFYFIFCCWTPKNFYLQCKHNHDYNDLIFHIFVDRFMPHSYRAEPEHNMHESLVLFIRTNFEEVDKIARSFFRQKGLTLHHYLEYIEKPGIRGDELAVHLLAMMQGAHYCIITKNNIYYSMPSVMPSPSAVHITLDILGTKCFEIQLF